MSSAKHQIFIQRKLVHHALFCSREPPKYLLEVLSAAAVCSKDPTTQRKYVFDQLYSMLKGRLTKGKLVYPYAFRAAVRKLFPSPEIGKYDVSVDYAEFLSSLL